METRCRGHGFSGVGSGVRGDLTSGQGLSSIHLGASGGRSQPAHRQVELCQEPESKGHRALQCVLGWGQGSIHQRQGHSVSRGGMVDFVSPIGHSTGHSPQL